MTGKVLRSLCGRGCARVSMLMALCALVLTVSCGKEEDLPSLDLKREIPFDRDQVLARTDEESVSVGEFINAFVRIGNYERLLEAAQTRNETSYMIEILDLAEDNHILAERARAEGIVDTEEAEDYVDRLRMDKIVDLFYVREILLKTRVTEEDLRKRYEEVKGERFTIPRKIKFKWIWISSDRWGWETAEERAREVASKLEGKSEFEELIYPYTDSDKSYRADDFGWYARGDIGTNQPLEDAAFELETIGEFAGPIRAGNGFHFIKLTAVQEEQAASFENARLVIRDEVLRDKVEEHLARLVENGLDTMDIDRNFDLLNDPDADDSALLFRVEDFRYPLGRFRRAVALQGLDRRSEQEDLLKQLLRNAIIYQMAIEAGYGKMDVEKTFRTLIDERFKTIYMENEIENRVQVSERDLLAQYEKEKTALQAPTRLQPYWLLIRAEVPEDAMRYQKEIAMRKAAQYANHIYYDLLLQNGEPFTDLARKYSHHQPTRDSGGDLGLYEGGNLGHVFDKVVFSMREGEICHPVQLRNGYCLIWLRKRFPSRQLSFDEARPDLYRRLRQERIDEMKKALLKDIREGRQWEADDELLRRLAVFLLEARNDRILQAQLLQ